MTTPPPDDQPTAAVPAPEPAEPTAPPAEGAPQPQPYPSGPPPGQPYPSGPPPGQPYPFGPPSAQPHPFAPVYRAPREPWVNPTRRAGVAGLAAAALLLAIGLGVLIGWAAFDGGGHGHRMYDDGYGRMYRAPDGYPPPVPGHPRLRPGKPGGKLPGATPTPPTPKPAPTRTG
jgi:hypothetical protein